MNQFVTKPRKSYRIEGFHDPVDESAHARYSVAVGMISEPDVERSAQVDLERHEFGAPGRSVSRKQAYSSAFGNSPVIGAADIGPHHQQVLLCDAGKPALEDFLGGRLVGKLHDQPVLEQFLVVFRGSVSVYIFLTGKEHHMHSPELDVLDVQRHRP